MVQFMLKMQVLTEEVTWAEDLNSESKMTITLFALEKSLKMWLIVQGGDPVRSGFKEYKLHCSSRSENRVDRMLSNLDLNSDIFHTLNSGQWATTVL